MSLKIFHTADLHIGKGYTTFDHEPEVKKDLKDRRIEVLDDMIEEANKQGCDLFVIAGDLFNDFKFTKGGHVEEVEPYFKGFEGKLILILPGNHDYCSESNVNRWNWVDEIDGVKVLKEKEPYNLSDMFKENIVFYPAPCNRKTSKKNRIEWIKDVKKDEEMDYHIGIAHGHLEGCSYDNEGKYFPMKKNELEESGLDFWLLGHIHISMPNEETRLKNYFFPGTPEQESFKKVAEDSEKGKAWVIELKDGNIFPQKVDVGKYTFHHEDFEIENMDDFKEMKDYLEDDGNKNKLLKLNISGRMDTDVFKVVQEYINDLRNEAKGFKYIEVDDDNFTRKIDMNLVKNEFSKESFPYRLLVNILEENDDVSEKAAELAYEKIEEMRE